MQREPKRKGSGLQKRGQCGGSLNRLTLTLQRSKIKAGHQIRFETGQGEERAICIETRQLLAVGESMEREIERRNAFSRPRSLMPCFEKSGPQWALHKSYLRY